MTVKIIEWNIFCCMNPILLEISTVHKFKFYKEPISGFDKQCSLEEKKPGFVF